MIGVLVRPAEIKAAREFFELCKTPWEFCQTSRSYEIILSTTGSTASKATRLLLVFDPPAQDHAARDKPGTESRQASRALSYGNDRLPLFGATTTFPQSTSRLLVDEVTRESVIHAQRHEAITVIRIGYNLFAEVRHLLSTGQPAAHAGTATLELHVQLLRDLITRAGLPLVEIPPLPGDHDFIVCLTHDIDNPVLRNHCGDNTMIGFLHRATLGSLMQAARGRIPVGRMIRNWAAAIRLPFVYLGLARDFWSEFDRYLQIEAGLATTYFFIPERDNPGKKKNGSVPAKRACRYTLAELQPQMQRILAAGNEIGLHGLNAWFDSPNAQREKSLIAPVTRSTEIGLRMHWLYFDEGSPAVLDQAGFAYDSTIGYNQTIGFRAGTTQVFRPLEAEQLLELPLHVMDTALFYPDYLNLDEPEAYRRVTEILENFTRFGGAFTINWHDRSIAPERLWGEFYIKLLTTLKQRSAWFATAGQAVGWFRQRRAAALQVEVEASGAVRVRTHLTKLDSTLPGLRIRVHRPHINDSNQPLAAGPDLGFVDTPFNTSTELLIAL